jgi:hypothetical protein
LEHRELVEKILVTAASIFITLALCIIALTSPAVGYEISIYDTYPAYFWFFLIATITCAVIILLRQAFAEKKSKKWVITGLMIVICTNTIILLLPMLRGYLLYGRGDTLTYLGLIRDILETGHVGRSNFYPIIHILGASLIHVTGLSIENIVSLFYILFSGIYIVNMYLLARSTSNHYGQVPLIVAFSSPLIYSFFHVGIYPNVSSLFMIPCLLYFYQKREQLPYSQRQNTTLLLLLAFFITFFHPVTTLFVIIIFLTFGFSHAVYSRFLRHETSETDQYRNVGKNFLRVSLIMFIAFFSWYFSYSSIERSFKRAYDWLVYQIGTPLVQEMLDPLAEAGLTPLQAFEAFMNRYGAIFILLLVSGMACISVVSKSLSRKRNVEPMKFTYATLFLTAVFIGAGMLFGYFDEYDPVRVARFFILMGTILSGLVVYDLINWERAHSKKNATEKSVSVQRLGFMIALGAVIMCMVILSIRSMYGSPYTGAINGQVTRMEIAGTEWFEGSKNPDIAVVTDVPTRIRRFEDYKFGVDSCSIIRAKVDSERLPSHFGYDKYDQIAEALDFQDRYLIMLKLDKIAPWARCAFFTKNGSYGPRVHEYTEDDFVKLNSDPKVFKLYCNGEFEVWSIYGEGK